MASTVDANADNNCSNSPTSDSYCSSGVMPAALAAALDDDAAADAEDALAELRPISRSTCPCRWLRRPCAASFISAVCTCANSCSFLYSCVSSWRDFLRADSHATMTPDVLLLDALLAELLLLAPPSSGAFD